MIRNPRGDLLRDLEDAEFAKLFGAERAKTDLAITFSRARRRLGMTQTEMAKRIGRSQPYIAKLEGGEANPTIATVGTLLATIGLRLVVQTEALVASADISIAKHTYPSSPPELENEWNLAQQYGTETGDISPWDGDPSAYGDGSEPVSAAFPAL
ncbi:MAG: helix-turn-helix domain-containing protein [Actinobacteria bacterium]|nr:helix-turn-helix domain-containing protein [Actinomycetota bacterium]MCL5026460.1 helix-turn-helix domain-containing protein [Chloroflexota bacterium]